MMITIIITIGFMVRAPDFYGLGFKALFVLCSDEDITPMAITLPMDGNTSSVMQENTYQ